MAITYHTIQKDDFETWLQLALKLWTDTDVTELRKDLMSIFDAEHQMTFLAKNEEHKAIGFINVSIRRDYVEGADHSPTGYLEGIYVEPAYRKKGVAKAMLQLGETWLWQHHCTQIGSDTWLRNKVSQAFHKRLGFREEEILVHFLKEIKPMS